MQKKLGDIEKVENKAKNELKVICKNKNKSREQKVNSRKKIHDSCEKEVTNK